MKILRYLHDSTPCPYGAGVMILSKDCRACRYYDGECVTQHIRCKYEDNNPKKQ